VKLNPDEVVYEKPSVIFGKSESMEVDIQQGLMKLNPEGM
jgi:hypothetical protein